MSPPAVVYVVAAVVGAAAVVAFKELIYEPHIAPTFEAWAEDFLDRRRAARNRRASAVPVRTSYRPNSHPSSVSSFHDDDLRRDPGENESVLPPNDFSLDGLELEALASKEVDDWRNEVLRSQKSTKDGLRKRRSNRLGDEFDGFDSMGTNTTFDESFTSLTHTPLPSTHVISNLSSPMTPSTVSLPQTPSRRVRSESQSTTMQGDVTTLFIAPPSSSSPIREMPVMSPRASPPGSIPMPPSPLAIPVADSPATKNVPHPLPFTPTHRVMADDSPFGPILPDTPRSSAEIYGKRPFSPIMRVMEPSSCSAAGSKSIPFSSVNSTSSTRTLGSSGVLMRPSGLANKVVMNDSDSDSGEDHKRNSAATFTLTNSVHGTNGSVISSLSERYPAPPTPPVIISPPSSSVSIISTPSSPGSSSSEVVVHHDAAQLHISSPPRPQTRSSLPALRLPSASSSASLLSRSRSAHSAVSPARSYTSFMSPMSISRAASESEGDEFLSVASDDSDWDRSSVTRRRREAVQTRANNSFLDLGQENVSEAGSDESWGSARMH